VQKCMSCHQNVATDRPEVVKLTNYWNSGEPMEWNRGYRASSAMVRSNTWIRCAR
jgi:hypothetical protein